MLTIGQCPVAIALYYYTITVVDCASCMQCAVLCGAVDVLCSVYLEGSSCINVGCNHLHLL